MQVIVYVDGKIHTTTGEQVVAVAGLERGEHSVKAELKDAKNRTIATTEQVVFFVRQPGLYNRALNRGG